jgi:threonylcarbamoyladenosine tRNA methylthiotransferase MtaB
MTVSVVTFGCRLNTAESEIIRRGAEAAGLRETLVFNTCAVTAEAARQARQAIRRARRDNPEARIVVTGCAAQVEPETFARMPEVDHVLGNTEKVTGAGWRGVAAHQAPKVRVADIFTAGETAPHLIHAIEGRTRAFIQVQNGCNHRCTFCIIPYGRGNSRSVPADAVVEGVRRAVDQGRREVVLTGVDLTSYGADLPGSPRLGTLVKAVLRHVPDLARLRLSSIDSVEADDDLLDALATEPRLMPHLHLSLQAGDDLILKRMKRRHDRAAAIRFCETVRRARPDVVFGADLIVGFPTETEAQFERSLDLVADCGLTHLHVFPFSPRPGTPAARMPQVAPQAVKDRAQRLLQAGLAAYLGHLAGERGRAHRVLVEKAGFGRIEAFTPTRVPNSAPPGSIVPVRVVGHDDDALLTEAA